MLTSLGKGTLLVTDLTVQANRPDSSADLATLRLPELQALASELGISGASKLRKGELVDAISEIQNNSTQSAPAQSTDSCTDAGRSGDGCPGLRAHAVKKRASRRASTAVVDTAAAAPVIDVSVSAPTAAKASVPDSAVADSAVADSAVAETDRRRQDRQRQDRRRASPHGEGACPRAQGRRRPRQQRRERSRPHPRPGSRARGTRGCPARRCRPPRAASTAFPARRPSARPRPTATTPLPRKTTASTASTASSPAAHGRNRNRGDRGDRQQPIVSRATARKPTGSRPTTSGSQQSDRQQSDEQQGPATVAATATTAAATTTARTNARTTAATASSRTTRTGDARTRPLPRPQASRPGRRRLRARDHRG